MGHTREKGPDVPAAISKHWPLQNEHRRAIKNNTAPRPSHKGSANRRLDNGRRVGRGGTPSTADVISAMMNSRRQPRTTRRNYPALNESLSNVLYSAEYFTVTPTLHVPPERRRHDVNAS